MVWKCYFSLFLVWKNKSFIKRTDTNLAEVTGVAKPIIQRALGKSNSPINTLVEGVTYLSAQVHSGEAFDQLMRRSNQLKVVCVMFLKLHIDLI